MLIEPASKVSVPLTVVMRTRSNAVVTTFLPAVANATAPSLSAKVPLAIHVFVAESNKDKVKAPCSMLPAPTVLAIPKPAVNKALAGVPLMYPQEPKYPLVWTLPPPTCICKFDVPLVETPASITVTLFTHDGMPVKSMLVPDVEATAVPETIFEFIPLTVKVPVPVGNVSV